MNALINRSLVAVFLIAATSIVVPNDAHAQAFPMCGDYTLNFDVPGLIPPATNSALNNDPLGSTTVITDQYRTLAGADNPGFVVSPFNPLPLGGGVRISATGGTGQAAVYNTDLVAPNGGANDGDPDLETPGAGNFNALIVQEQTLINIDPVTALGRGQPDDVTAGIITFDFELPLVRFAGTFVDFEEEQVEFTFINVADDGTILNTQTVTNAELAIGSGSNFEQPAGSGCTLADGARCNIDIGLAAGDPTGVAQPNSLLDLPQFNRLIVDMSPLGGSSGGVDDILIEVACGTLMLQGNVFNDLNALDDNAVNGAGTNVNGQIFVSLVDSAGLVVDSVAVNAGGDYTFSVVDPNTSYTVQLNTSLQAVGAAPSAPSLPVGFENTGENLGAGVGSDGIVNGILSVDVVAADVTNANFGTRPAQAVAGADIGDLIFYDLNGDGVFNGNDSGIAGVEVQICSDITTTNTVASDNFNTVSYANDSTIPSQWNGDWFETGEATNPAAGDILINGTQLLLSRDSLAADSVALRNLTREVDLSSANGVNSATLSIDWAGGAGNHEPSDTYVVEISTNGGTSFTAIHTFQAVAAGPVGDDTTITTGGDANQGLSGTVDITFNPAGSANALIRFVVNDSIGPGEELLVDNLSISTTGANNVCSTTTTDANGAYLFTNQVDNTYTLTVDPNVTTLPLNRIDPVPTVDPQGAADGVSIVVLANADDLNQDFGYQPNQISGNISRDDTGNGLGDVNLSSVVVQLYTDPNSDGNPVDGVLQASVVSDAFGNYVFSGTPLGAGTAVGTGVPIDDYVVVEIDPAGLRSVNDGDASTVGDVDTANVVAPIGIIDNLIPVDLTSGEIDADNNFVDGSTARLSGTVWLDEDLDGIFDTEETGITGVTVVLFDGAVEIARTITNANGGYTFENVPSGDYTVDIDDNSAPLTNLQNTAGIGGLDPKSVSIEPGDDVRDVDFGYIPQTNEGAIGDRVWSDSNGNGIQDPGESGISGVSLTLTNSDGSPVLVNGVAIAPATTNLNGDYLFTGVPFGDDYLVNIEPTDPNLAGFSVTQGPQSEGRFVSNPVTLSVALTVVTDVDFGFNNIDLNTITDFIWFDSDADGVFDADEAGIANVTVNLVDEVTGQVIATTITDETGAIVFAGVPNGNYRIVISDNNDEIGPLNGTTVPGINRDSGVITVADADVNGINFGYNNPGLISGTIYSDSLLTDSDQNPGEAGFSGVVITLTPPATVDLGNGLGVAINTTTAADGRYMFDGLPPGNYSVSVASPGGSQTEDPDGINDNVTLVSLGIGESSVQNDFGYVTVPDVFDLSGTVFNDPDRDGIEDAGELGIEGVTLNLIDRNLLDAYDIIDGMVDINGDGRVTIADDGLVNGINIIDSSFDIDGDGDIDEDDNGTVGAFDIVEGMVNIAQAGTASQSSTLRANFEASFGNDGNPRGNGGGNGTPGENFFPHTGNTGNETDTEYWQVDLGSVQSIGTITIFNRDNDAFVNRLASVRVLVADTPFPTDPADMAGAIANADFSAQIGNPVTAANPDPVLTLADFGVAEVSGQFIRLQKAGNNPDSDILNFAEVKITPAFIQASSDGVVATTTADALGNYTFSGLANGDYSVAVTDTAVRLAGFDITSGLDELDRTIDGANETDVDFGYIREEATASISGEVFIDENDNGNAQDEEFNLSNVDVHLCLAPLDTGINLPNGVVSFARYAGQFANTTQIDTIGALTSAADATASTFTLLAADAPTGVDNFGYVYQGFINISVAGDYRFRTTSDDGSVVFIDGTQVVFNDALQAPNTETSDVVTLTTGFHSIEVRYFESVGGQAFSVEFETPGAVNFTPIPATALSSFTDLCNPAHPNFVATTTTDVNGEYIFTGLPSAQYVIDSDPQDIPPGLSQTVDPATVNVSEGENVTDVDHGYNPTPINADDNAGVLSGFVWVDVNANGNFDAGEAPIQGVTINVFRANGAPGSAPVLTTTTGPDGSWIISNIVDNLVDDLFVVYQANDVTVDGVTTNGIDSAAGVNLNEVQPTNLPIGDNVYNPVPLLSDDDNNIANLDFGFDPGTTNLGSISGSIYTDADQNGDLGNNSPSVDTELRDVTVNLLDAAGNVIATTRTDANGEYAFVGLNVGDAITGINYQVVITDNINVTRDLNPLETLPVLINLRDVAGSSANPTAGVRNAVQQDAGFISDTDFFSIGNRFFFDSNGDGISDDNEPGIEGVTVQCWLDVDQSETPNDPSIASSEVTPEPGIDNLIRTVVTDENGEYVCTSLPNGNYIVVVADSNGFDEAADGTRVLGAEAGANPSDFVGDNFAKNWNYALTLGIDNPDTAVDESSQPNFSADFGVSGTNSLSGLIFVEPEALVEPVGVAIVPNVELDGVAGGPSDDSSTNGVDLAATVNVPVDLLLEQEDGSFQVIQTTTTDADGRYNFEGLPDGRYQVRVRPTGTGIDGYGQTGDPDLAAILAAGGDVTDLVCDSDTSALCDNTAGDPIDLDSAGALTGDQTVTDINFGYQRGFATTPVTINFFSATRSGDSVTFIWETSNEVGHAGFQVYARNTDGWELLNDQLLVGNLDVRSETEVKQYVFEAQTEAKWFSLVDISNSEEVVARGPFEVGEEYGANLGEKESFDWSLIDVNSTLSLEEVRSMVESKLGERVNEEDELDQDFEDFLDEVDLQDAQDGE